MPMRPLRPTPIEMAPPVDKPPEELLDDEDRSRSLREVAERERFALVAVATHLPLTSAVPRPHSSVQTRSLRLTTASNASAVGSSFGTDTLALRAKLASASRPLSPH